MRRTFKEPRRLRTIRWKVVVDEAAKRMAAARYPDGSVSRLIEQLISEEAERESLEKKAA